MCEDGSSACLYMVGVDTVDGEVVDRGCGGVGADVDNPDFIAGGGAKLVAGIEVGGVIPARCFAPQAMHGGLEEAAVLITQNGCSAVAVIVSTASPASPSTSTVISTRSFWPWPTIVATTFWGSLSPVSGSVANTRSPSSTSWIGLVEPSANNTRVPGAKLLQPAGYRAEH